MIDERVASMVSSEDSKPGERSRTFMGQFQCPLRCSRRVRWRSYQRPNPTVACQSSISIAAYVPRNYSNLEGLLPVHDAKTHCSKGGRESEFRSQSV